MHGWVISSRCFTSVYLFVDNLVLVLVWLISTMKKANSRQKNGG